MALAIPLSVGTVFAESARSDVVVESGFDSMRSTSATDAVVPRLEVDSEVDRCDMVRVKIVNPDSVVAADVPRPTDSRLLDLASLVALGLAAGGFFFGVVIVCLPMWWQT